MTHPQLNRRARIAVVGAGLIGRRHIKHVDAHAQLHAVVDPAQEACDLAAGYQVPHFSHLETLLASNPPDGVIIATPTPMHFDNAMACIASGIPALIEKPITGDATEAQALITAAAQAAVPLLVGHHRRYNPIIWQAKQIIESGRLGKLITTNAMCWLYKPDAYFYPSWRRDKGAGPILTNLIHDVDLLRYLCGEVAFVQAVHSSAHRGFDIEDTAAILLGFANGVLGTITLSDTVVAPWSWELTAGENRAYPQTNQSAYLIGGTRGSLSLPDLGIWHNGDTPGWWQPISRESMPIAAGDPASDPLVLQLQHFCAVIAGTATPLVSGAEGLATLRVIEAIVDAADKHSRIDLPTGY
ncbi:MAG: Gfo/Idh/MocA family oxidoreductase [Burkholderiaceae bacterium]